MTEASRGRGFGVKMLDFARKKLEEHPHPVLSVLDTNARAKHCIPAWAGSWTAAPVWNLTRSNTPL